MRTVLIVVVLMCVGCGYSSILENETRFDSGLELVDRFSYSHTTFSLDERYDKALNELTVFPDVKIVIFGSENLLRNLETHVSLEKFRNKYLTVRNKEKYEKKVLELSEKYHTRRSLHELKAEEALVLLSQIIRFQLSEESEIDEEVLGEIQSALKILESRKDFGFSVFDVMSVDEYFLAGHRRVGYYCGMISWNAVNVFNILKQNIPSLTNIFIFECGIRGPSHSFNLFVSSDNDKLGLYLVDFQKEKFWDMDFESVSSAQEMINQLDMSSLGISRLGR